jgi:PAS domain S-box-containing protein
VKDDQSRLLIVNDAFCELFGLKKDDIIGKTLAEDVSPTERESFLKIDKQVLSDGVGNINEETLTLRGGPARIISTRKTRFINSDGKAFLVGVIHDITELKLAKAHDKEHEERFRIWMLNMEAGVIVHAPDTSIVQNNIRASEILGLSDDQLKGKTAIDPHWKFVHLDKSPLPLSEYPVNRIASSKTSIKNQLVGIYQPHKDDVVWVTVNGFPVLNAGGNITEIVTIFIDITEQKKNEDDKLIAQLKLEKTQQELINAQELANVGSWLFNPSSQKSEWSGEMYRIWGFDSKKGAPEFDPILERVHPDDLDFFNAALTEAIGAGTPFDIEFIICIPNEEPKTIRSICKPVLGVSGEIISLTGSTQDITEQKQFEAAQVKHQRLKAIGEMSSSIAHDFNNALQEMMGNLEVVKLQTDLSDSSVKRLNNIGSIISDVAGRVSALQKFGGPENDDKNAQLIDLNELIEESLEQSRPLWKDSMEKEGLRITVETDFGKIPKISCNNGELKSAVHNIIKNSIEAMPEGGHLMMQTSANAESVFATFTDTGIGMSEETQLKIFEPFFTTKGFKLGRGLGMSGVYSIVKKYSGEIKVKSSELNKGTTIEIVFPVSHKDEIKVLDKDEPKDHASSNVLWVDDDFIIAKSAQMMVESIGHKCKSVNSGEKALEYLNNNPCDIVFTDIGMPMMNGWELAEAIRKKFGNKTTIVAVTGWSLEKKVEEEKSFDYFLKKPFALHDLKLIFLVR